MDIKTLAVAFLAIELVAGAAAAADETVQIPIDGETTAGGVPVACTGFGQTKLDPRWTAYPVRVEFSGPANEYLASEAITIWDAHKHVVLSASCEGPWILLKLAPGSYRVEGRLLELAAKPRTAPFKAPAKGQIRVVLQFKDAQTGALAPGAPAAPTGTAAPH
ncbi:MAG TPA: hypothetical protein VMT68_17785 [Caulobacteraceae bacterium]|nr:hypothetical protein [Caulobacteraceae bacterium]